MVPYMPCSIHEEVGHASYVWQIYEKCLLHCFTAFIKYSIKLSKNMSNIVKDFNDSRKLCNIVNLKLRINTVLQIFVFICSKRVQVQDKT